MTHCVPGGFFDTFGGRGGKKPLELKIFLEIAEHRYGDLWRSEATRVDAIKQTLCDAIERLPGGSLPGAPPEGIPWQKAALIMYRLQVPNSAIREEIRNQHSEPQWHNKLASYVRKSAGFPENGDFQKVCAEMRDIMAKFLLQEDAKMSQPASDAIEMPDTEDEGLTDTSSNVEDAEQAKPTIPDDLGVKFSAKKMDFEKCGFGNGIVMNFGKA